MNCTLEDLVAAIYYTGMRYTEESGTNFSWKVSIDGRWRSPKYDIQETVSTVNPVNHQFLEFVTLTKKRKSRENDNYTGTSNN